LESPYYEIAPTRQRVMQFSNTWENPGYYRYDIIA